MLAGRSEEAVKQFKEFGQITSDKSVAYEYIAEVYMQDEMYEQAIEYLKKQLKRMLIMVTHITSWLCAITVWKTTWLPLQRCASSLLTTIATLCLISFRRVVGTRGGVQGSL